LLLLEGVSASPGIVIGEAYVIKEKKEQVTKKNIADVDAEIERLHLALENAKDEIIQIKNMTAEKISNNKASIFEAQLLLLEDPELIPLIEKKIRIERINAEASVSEAINYYKQLFSSMDDEYIKARMADIKDAGERVIRILRGDRQKVFFTSKKAVLFARDLVPSDTAQLDTEKIIAFVTEEGSRTSHSVLFARSMNITAVVGVGKGATDKISNGDQVIIDGDRGKAIINPTKDILERYLKKKKAKKTEKENVTHFRNKLAHTKDGIRIKVVCNIGNIKGVNAVLEQGGEGIGLFRTEFLLMEREELPGEDEQFEAYKFVVEKMAPRPVIIRTIDIGGDKHIPYLNLPNESNPFLGYRGVRIYFDHPELFKPQLRAIIRASAFGQVKIMFPMVTCLKEVKLINFFINETKNELKKEKKTFNPNIEVGIMIEVPGAALIADILAREVAFFSLGTNDLIQYTLAADRNNNRVSHIYNPYHPAVLKIIKHVVNAGHEHGIWVGICGEEARNNLLIPFLLGVGIDELSLDASSVLKTKQLISRLGIKEARKVVDNVMDLKTGEEIKRELKKFYSSRLS
jgi:phosphotransferase system enzyme I (PtsI)